MRHKEQKHKANEAVIDRLITRHESWRNSRRHTALKLIRFS
ncbi:hypothetical protein [Aurantibacter sp.]